MKITNALVAMALSITTVDAVASGDATSHALDFANVLVSGGAKDIYVVDPRRSVLHLRDGLEVERTIPGVFARVTDSRVGVGGDEAGVMISIEKPGNGGWYVIVFSGDAPSVTTLTRTAAKGCRYDGLLRTPAKSAKTWRVQWPRSSSKHCSIRVSEAKEAETRKLMALLKVAEGVRSPDTAK